MVLLKRLSLGGWLIDHAAVHRAPTPAPHGGFAAEAHGVGTVIHDEAALPQPQFKKRNSRPLQFTPVRFGFIHHAALRTRTRNRVTRYACRLRLNLLVGITDAATLLC